MPVRSPVIKKVRVLEYLVIINCLQSSENKLDALNSEILGGYLFHNLVKQPFDTTYARKCIAILPKPISLKTNQRHYIYDIYGL